MSKRIRNPEILIEGINFDVTDIRHVFLGDPVLNKYNPEIEEFSLHIMYGYPLEHRIFIFDSEEKIRSILYELNSLIL